MRLSALLSSLLLFAVAQTAAAAIQVFDSRAAFDAATASFDPQVTIDFDAAAAGTLIASGSTFEQIGFGYSILDDLGDDLTLVVDDLYDTTSAPNYLALQAVDGSVVNFLLGDELTLSFPFPVDAAAVALITESVLFPGEGFSLTVDEVAGEIGSDAASTTLGDGSIAYFLGIVSDVPFATVTLGSWGDELPFNVDDIRYAVVPLPASLTLLVPGLVGLAWAGRRRTHNTKRRFG